MESTPVSPEDQSLVFNGLGTYFVVNLVGVVSETGLWAIYLVLFCWAMRLQTSRKQLRNPSPAKIVLLILTIILFLSSTALWAMNVSQLTIATKGFFLNYPTLGLLERNIELNGDIRVFGLPMEALFLSNMILGDSVVIWRAWVLCQNTRMQRLVYIPIVMLLTGFAFMVIALECLSANGYGNQSAIPVGAKVCQWGEPIAWGISLVTNFVSTCLIAVRAWEHRQFLRKSAALKGTRSEKILIVLTESGFIYCLFWLTQLNLFFDNPMELNFVTFLQVFLNGVGDQISGVYPTIIIILVNKHRSISQFDETIQMSSLSNSRSHTRQSSSARPKSSGLLSTIQFTPGASETGSTLNVGQEGGVFGSRHGTETSFHDDHEAAGRLKTV
ncbi:hypothetical protein PQX77_008752 [Marasmius sp. AFHP31]|nr:hypothetical protein PQX77_008752 [Marasmius sp. AFHP31]